jgi:hypothetical protein
LLTHGLEFKKDAQLAGNCLILIAPCWGWKELRLYPFQSTQHSLKQVKKKLQNIQHAYWTKK